jgi:hypothetical protein
VTDKVVLEYKRVNVDKSTGRIVRITDVGEDVLSVFESIEFRPMLREFAEALQQCEDAVAVWKRTDRPGLISYDLDPQTTKLFRTDPVAAIESLCPPARNPATTVKRVQEEKQQKLVPVSIRVGYDVLADALGDDVYSRLRTRKEGIQYGECPCCGLWMPIGMGYPASRAYYPEDGVGWSLCANTKCRASSRILMLKVTNDKWVGYSVVDLLATDAPRFYFPRTWNEGRPWITWDELHKKYHEYLKEKEKHA